MKNISLHIVVLLLRVVYIPFKFLRVQNKITLISRQSDEAPADFMLIQKSVKEAQPEIKTRILAKKLETKKIGIILYPLHMIRQMYHIASSKIVLLDGYCIVASTVTHKCQTKIIQMWHAAAAVKKFGWQTIDLPSGTNLATASILNMHGNYDYVLAPSEVTGEIYQQAFRVDSDKILYYGLPHFIELCHPDNQIIKKIIKEYGIDSQKKTILYVPTFRESKSVNIEELTSEIDFNQYNLIVKVHPLDRLNSNNMNIIYADRFSTMEWMQLADIVITDYSSLMVEVAVMMKPLYLYVYDLEEYKKSTGLNMNFEAEAISDMIFTEAADLVCALQHTYDFEKLAMFRDKYIQIDVTTNFRDLMEFILDLMHAEEIAR